MKYLSAFLLMAMFMSPALANEKLQKVLEASPQLNGNCSSSLIYSDRDKKTGEVKSVLLTAKHCVADIQNQEMYADFPVYQDNRVVEKRRFMVRVLGTDYKSDLALLQLVDKQTFFESVNKIGPEKLDMAIGDPVITVGYPAGMNLTVTSGLFVGYQSLDWPTDGFEYLRTTPDIMGGNSGGQTFKITKAGDYEQIGVTCGVLKGNPFMGLYTSVNAIRAYLKTALPEALGEAPAAAVAVKYGPY
jgi:hypothetical protein